MPNNRQCAQKIPVEKAREEGPSIDECHEKAREEWPSIDECQLKAKEEGTLIDEYHYNDIW